MAGIINVDKWTRVFHDMATGKAPTTQDFYVVETTTKPIKHYDVNMDIPTNASQTLARARARVARKKSNTKKFINRGRKRACASRGKKKTSVKKRAAARKAPVKPRKKTATRTVKKKRSSKPVTVLS